MLTPDIPETDSRKPDPSEPFRYVTPCCGRQPLAQQRSRIWTCSKCGERYREKQNLRDLKTGQAVAKQADPGPTGTHGI